LSVTVSVTVYEPAAAYVCDGLCAVDVAPSPKVQLLLAIDPSGSLLVLENVQLSALQLEVNAAVGDWFAAVTVMLCDVELVAPWLSVTVSDTVYVPAAE
jgi:hypothetical protein